LLNDKSSIISISFKSLLAILLKIKEEVIQTFNKMILLNQEKMLLLGEVDKLMDKDKIKLNLMEY